MMDTASACTRKLLRSTLALTLAAAGLALAVPATAQGRTTTVVVGQLINAEDHTPLPSATVRVTGTNTTVVTGPDGQFLLRLRPGTYNVALFRLGFETALETWEIGNESLDVGMIELEPDAIQLEALTVQLDRVERTRRASGMTSRVYAEEELAQSTHTSAIEFISSRQGFIFTPCSLINTGGGRPDCIRVRGTPRRPCVVIDEAPAPGGFAALDAYPPRQLARINVYGRGSFIQVYTTAFMRSAARRNWNPDSVENQMAALCSFS